MDQEAVTSNIMEESWEKQMGEKTKVSKLKKIPSNFCIILGDARYIPLGDQSVNCIITSPPYWSLRKYDIPDLIAERLQRKAVGIDLGYQKLQVKRVEPLLKPWKINANPKQASIFD